MNPQRLPRRRPPVDPPCTPHDHGAVDALLVAAGNGDLAAFAAFYDRTAPMVFGLLHGVLGRPARAEDVTAQVYLALWHGCPGFDPADRSAVATVLWTARRALAVRLPGPREPDGDHAGQGPTG